MFRQLILELVDRGLPLLKMGRLIGEEDFEGVDELFGLGDILVEIFPAILVDDGPVGGLKEDVVTGVAGVEFLLNLLFQVVVGVLGLPVAVGQLEVVHQGAVHAEVAAALGQGDIAPPG